jgi:putative selenium metabolism hydrolase
MSGATGINEQDLITLCQAFVAEPSLPGNERGVANAIRRALANYDYDEVTVDDFGNVVAIRRAPAGRGTVAFDAHIDTVSPGNVELWSSDPYGARQVDGNLVGRGVADMKGAAAAMIVGLASVPREELTSDVILSCSVCEEAVEGVALGLVLDNHPADIVVIGESTECELAIGQRGRGELLVETFGRAAHSSTPHLGINSVKHMAKVIERLSQIEPPHDPVLGYGVMEVTDVKSNPYPGLSVIPEHCAATFDRRLLVQDTEESLLRSIETALDDVRTEIPELNARVSIPKTDVVTYPGTPLVAPKFAPAWLFPQDHPAVIAALDALEQAGLPQTTRTYSFCTNGSESAGRRGIPTIGFGPGSEEQAHRVDESVPVEQLVYAARGYAALARTLGNAIE